MAHCAFMYVHISHARTYAFGIYCLLYSMFSVIIHIAYCQLNILPTVGDRTQSGTVVRHAIHLAHHAELAHVR